MIEHITFDLKVTKNNELAYIITFDGFLIILDIKDKN